MRKNRLYKKLLYLFWGCLVVSCSKMDATYKPFVVPNGINYIGKADSVQVYSGRKRVKIAWLRGTDPKASKAIIYWNNKADSVTFPITHENPDDTVNIIINDLPEGSYSFQIYTFDEKGNNSIKVDALGHSYDSLYESGLLIRPVDSVFQSGKDAIIKWFAVDTTSFATEVHYTDTFAVKHTIFVPLDSMTTTLTDYKFSMPFTYRSLYKPKSLCIDTFFTTYDTAIVHLLPQNPNLALNKDIADKSSDGSSGRATELLDGDQSTHWQPLGSDRRDDQMVWVTIDLGSSETFNELNQFWTHGHQHVNSYKIYYSDDRSTWETAYESTSGPDEGDNIITFSAVTGRYVKLELHFLDDGNVNIGEVEIYNDPSVSPPENLALNKSTTGSSGGSQPASNTVDGDNSTYWQPYSADRKDDQMVSVTIDLGSAETFNELDQYWTHGHSKIDSYKVYYSDDNSTWQIAYESTSGPTSGANMATFSAVTGRYVKLELHFGNDGNVNIAEVEIWNR